MLKKLSETFNFMKVKQIRCKLVYGLSPLTLYCFLSDTVIVLRMENSVIIVTVTTVLITWNMKKIAQRPSNLV